MVTKTITIMEDAYDLLFRSKLEGESFSDTIRRITSKQNSKKGIEEFFGVWSNSYSKNIKDNIKDMRTRGRERAKRRDEQFSV